MIWNKLKPSIKELHEVRVWENRKKGTSVIYREKWASTILIL